MVAMLLSQARLDAALGSHPRPGALGHLLRLKGFCWLATRNRQQGHVALAGTQFTLAPGPPWWAAVPRHMWPEGLAEELLRDQVRFRLCMARCAWRVARLARCAWPACAAELQHPVQAHCTGAR